MPFQLAVAYRFFQRQGGNNPQAARWVGLDTVVQRIDERVRFTDAQWNAKNDVAGDAVEYVIDGRITEVNPN